MILETQTTSERHAPAPVRSSDLFAIATEWRRDAAANRDSYRLHELAGDRCRADRHYQRSLDLDACAKRIEDLVNQERSHGDKL